MSGFQLKILASVSMLIDHIGDILLPEMIWLRLVGRLAFPIFCFLLVEGFYYTHNRWKYLLRLGLFALISEIPFHLAFLGKWFQFGSCNVFFTLFLGLLTITAVDALKNWSGKLAVIALGTACGYFLGVDYRLIGVLMICSFYFFRQAPGERLVAVLVCCVIMGGIQYAGVLALVPISLYNHKKGYAFRFGKYIFYVFYPAHLLVLYAIARMNV